MSDLESVEKRVRNVERDLGGVGRRVASVGSDLSTIGTQVGAVQSSVNSISRALDSLDDEQQATQAAIATLHEDFRSFQRDSRLAQQKQSAQTTLIEVNQTLERDFGYLREIRRSAVGVLQAMDSGLVRAETVRGLSEELMITTPRYWLAPALVALGAWMRGDHELAGRAVAEAVGRDRDKAALFFLLVLQRWRRDAAVARWIEEYVDHLDPLSLTPEFRIVLDATTTGLFGDTARDCIADTVRRWTDGLGAHPPLAEKQVRRWVAVIEGLRSTPPDRPALREHSPDWTRLVDLAGRASVFGHADEFLDAGLAAPAGAADGLEVRVDEVLDRLTGDFDRDEAPLRHRAADLQAVVDHDGDLEAARRSRAGAAATDPTTDFLSLLGDAALDDDTVAPPATRRLAIVLSRSWAAAAVERIADRLRAEWPAAITIRHDGWQGVLDEENDDDALIARAREHHDRRTADEVAAVRFGGWAWLGVLVGTLGLALGIVALVSGHVVLGIVCLVVAGVAGLWVYSEYTALPGRRARATADGERRKDEAEDVIRTTAAEGVRWLDDFEAALTAADTLRDRLTALDVDDHLGSPQAADRRR